MPNADFKQSASNLVIVSNPTTCITKICTPQKQKLVGAKQQTLRVYYYHPQYKWLFIVAPLQENLVNYYQLQNGRQETAKGQVRTCTEI